MIVPQEIWDQKLANGLKLHENVEYLNPDIVPINDINAFISIWEERLDDASHNKAHEEVSYARSIIDYTKSHTNGEVVLLMWPQYKCLFDISSKDWISM